MTKKYRLKGGDLIVAASAAEFLHKLHSGSRFDNKGTDADYMQRFAHRLEELEGYRVKTDNPDVFLSDLLHRGFVRIE
jgi:hypothetical protein